MLMSILPPMGKIPTKAARLKTTFTFNNVAHNTLLKTSWGFSCMVETAHHTILFDRVATERFYSSIVRHLGFDPATIDMIVLSHLHADHAEGLEPFLQANSKVTTYLPRSFRASF